MYVDGILDPGLCGSLGSYLDYMLLEDQVTSWSEIHSTMSTLLPVLTGFNLYQVPSGIVVNRVTQGYIAEWSMCNNTLHNHQLVLL